MKIIKKFRKSLRKDQQAEADDALAVIQRCYFAGRASLRTSDSSQVSTKSHAEHDHEALAIGKEDDKALSSTTLSLRDLDMIAQDIEDTYSQVFAHGKIDEGRAKLLTRKWRPTDWRTFNRGLNIGIMLQLMLWVTWFARRDSGPRWARAAGARLRCAFPRAQGHLHGVEHPPVPDVAAGAHVVRLDDCPTAHLQVLPPLEASVAGGAPLTQRPLLPPMHSFLRGIGCVTLALWCWGVCLYCWERVRVNFYYVFEFDEQSTLRHSEVFDRATGWTTWFLANFLLFFKSLHGVNPMPVAAPVFPFLLFASLIAFFASSAGRLAFLGQTLGQIAASPFGAVSFWYSFAADGLTSLVQPMADLVYAGCYFGTLEFLRPADAQGGCATSPLAKNLVGPLCAALPLWWRLCQNLRKYHMTHNRFPWLANALKYATSMTVVIFGVFHPSVQRRGSFTWYQATYLLAFCGAALRAPWSNPRT